MPASHEARHNKQTDTYFVDTRGQREELARLSIQDRMLTEGMGGPLAEQMPPLAFQRVLDIGCGPGGWLMQVAHLPSTLELLGIDINQGMIEYASAQARQAQLAERLRFQVMDALKPLALPTAHFDLVNIRLGSSYLRTWDWPNLLAEAWRVMRPGGTMRLVDTENGHQSNSAALTQLFAMLANALFQAGHSFTSERTGLVAYLPRLLAQQGFTAMQTTISPLEFHAGTSQGDAYYNNLVHMQNLRFFIQKWSNLQGDFEALWQESLQDARQSGFISTWTFHTVWALRP